MPTLVSEVIQVDPFGEIRVDPLSIQGDDFSCLMTDSADQERMVDNVSLGSDGPGAEFVVSSMHVG